MPDTQDGIGCRDAAVATSLLLGFATVFFALGLTLINRERCDGWCELVGLATLYAGGPVSALFGVFTDSVMAAWPLDVTLWVSLGFVVAARSRRPLSSALLLVLVAAGYGLVLSQLVELTA